MGLIKGVLSEELGNAIRLKKNYEAEILSHPGGSLVKKKLKGHEYYYLAHRVGRKVKFDYKGKVLSQDFMAQFEKEKKLRKKYKGMVRQLNQRIKYLRRVLRGKEDV